jgi:hypothetical protein
MIIYSILMCYINHVLPRLSAFSYSVLVLDINNKLKQLINVVNYGASLM